MALLTMLKAVDPTLWVAGVGTATGAAALYYVNRSVKPIIPFLYSNARIMARTKYFISKKQWAQLSESKSLSILISSLRETDYFENVENATNLRAFHFAVEKTIRDSILNLKQISPKIVYPLLDKYVMFIEGKVIKTIYRATYAQERGTENDEELNKRELVFAVGSISDTLLQHMIAVKTVADLGVVMANTDYADVFSKNYDAIESFEVAIDSFILNAFLETASNIKVHEKEHIIHLFNTKVDILNIMTMIKAKIRQIPCEQRKNLLIKNKTNLSERFKELVNAETFHNIVSACENLPYHEPLSKALFAYKKDKSLSHFEKELLTFYYRFVVDAELSHSQGPYPIFSYLAKKEVEQRNLFAISKGIELKFSAEEIKEVLIH